MKIRDLMILFIVAVGLNACAPVKTSKSWEEATLTSELLPGISIRAIEIINDSTVYFVANDGQVGVTMWEIMLG